MSENKKTVILGASTNPERYSYKATHRLMSHGHDVALVGIKKGAVNGETIQHGEPEVKDVHTVTLYVNPKRQEQYYNYILSLKPERIIYNPGTENPELMKLAKDAGIHNEVACTLVMLASNTY